jgi:6,7-dimethyl-8-ribityllumazine synthase
MKTASKRKVPQKKTSQKLATPKIAIVCSLFNEDIVGGLMEGCLAYLEEQGISRKIVRVFKVPGAFEIPLITQKVAQSKKFDGVIALGCVIRGDTPHFEFVSLAATMGVLQAGLNTGVPILFGVITVNNLAQAQERSGRDHFNKGREAAMALFDTLTTLETL